MNVLLLYFHRYLRLTPLLAVALLISVSMTRFGNKGPLFVQSLRVAREQCQQYWWSTLLYIQNFVNPGDLVSFAKELQNTFKIHFQNF